MHRKQLFIQILRISIIWLTGVFLIAACGDNNNETNPPSNNDGLGTAPGSYPMDNTEADTTQDGQTFEAELAGDNEVPEVETDADGSMTVTLAGDSIHVEGEFSGLSSDYAASHIHKGAEDENGDPIQTLKPDVGSDKTSGTWDASYTLDEDQIRALKADSLYINVHSADHTSGEIRGQLSSGGF